MCRAARASEQVGKAKFFGGKFVARKTAEVTAAHAEGMRASFRGSVKEAEDSAAGVVDYAGHAAARATVNAESAANRSAEHAGRVLGERADRSVDNAGRVFRRSAVVGGVSLGGGLSIPVVVNHMMAGKRERKRSKMRVAKGNRWPDKKERKVVRRAVFTDPATYGLLGAEVAGLGVMGYGGIKYLNQEGPLLRRKYPPHMQVLQPDNAGVFRPVPFRNGVRGLTGRGKLAALAGGGLLVGEIANRGGQARSHRVANRAREKAGYPHRTFWTGAQKKKSRIKKAWKGEPGDKRNSKYALAALSGSVVPGVGSVVVPVGYGMYRSMDKDGMRRREISIANSKKERETKRKNREKRKIKKALSPQTRSVMSKQNYLLGSGVTLVDLSKAMSPNKLQSLQRMANGSRTSRADADYARNRLASYRVGQGANPSPSQTDRFARAARSAASSPAYRARNYGEGRRVFNAGVAASTGANTAAPGYMSAASRKLRMKNGFQERLGYRLP